MPQNHHVSALSRPCIITSSHHHAPIANSGSEPPAPRRVAGADGGRVRVTRPPLDTREGNGALSRLLARQRRPFTSTSR